MLLMFQTEGLVTILQRVQPIFIFCDTDVLGPVEEKAKKAGIKAIIFTVNGLVPGYDSIESLFKQSGQEHEFKYVYTNFVQILRHFISTLYCRVMSVHSG